jgi:hypothetical protein
MEIRNNHGSALPIVLVFSVFALIVTTIYTTGQFSIAKPGLTAPALFQALCNARSGVWKAMELSAMPPPDTLKRINTLDSMFNKNLFGKQSEKINDSAALSPDDTTDVQPFSTDSFGSCKVFLTYKPCYKVFVSLGLFRSSVKTATAVFGGALFTSPDTVCYLGIGDKIQGGGIIEGKTCLQSAPHGPGPGGGTGNIPVVVSDIRTNELSKVVSYYRAKFAEKNDTTFKNSVLTVQDNAGFSKVPEIVNGPLFIDGSHHDLVWKDNRRVFIIGDLQITGKTAIEDIEFVVSGEVKCFDNCRLRNVSVFCGKKLTIGDNASFAGNAMTLSAISIFKRARVEEKSILVAYGENKQSSSPVESPGTNKIKLLCSVFLSQDAKCDAVIVACGDPGGIMVDRNVVVRGGLWASGIVCQQGTVYGVLRCKQLVNTQQLNEMQKMGMAAGSTANNMTGSVRRLNSIADYYCPFFLGKPAIVRWEER